MKILCAWIPSVIICFYVHLPQVEAQIDICTASNITSDSGTLTSPNYPNNYDNNLDCETIITTSADKVIAVAFVVIDLPWERGCPGDYLEVYDGTEMYTSKRLCGTEEPKTFVTTNSSVRIVFHTDASTIDRGFNIQWSTEAKCANDQYRCWDGACIPGDQHCDRVKHCSDDSDEVECVQLATATGECGKVKIAPQFTWDPRIVGGNQAVSGSWPWQIGLTMASGYSPFCGGVIISNKWILTAAHCVDTVSSPSIWRVDAGKHSFVGGANQSSIVSQVIIHSSYVNVATGFDIALLRLATPLTYNSIVSPVCIPTESFATKSADTVIATGWGTLEVGGDHPSTLHQVRLPVVSNADCNTRYSTTIYDSQICAGDTTTGGVDSCQGDSGGPLVMLVNECTWYVVGITSYGRSCGLSNYPGVYTRVSSFNSWIKSFTSDTSSRLTYSVCNASTVTADSGTVTTPNYPNPYDNNLQCSFTISTNANKVIAVTFVSMDIETHTSCNWDYIEIYNGNEFYTSKRFCGTQKPGDFVSSSSSVRITFHSDSLVSRPGFEIQWTTEDRCSSNEFTCWNGTCIPSSEHCDGIRNCTDDSDEIECTQTSASSECGKVFVAPQFTWDPRIVGGNEAIEGSWPWQVAIAQGLATTPFCGGTIISTNWILTAAHCLSGISSNSSIRVDAGKHVRDGGAQQSITVRNVLIHPSYISVSNGFDIALLELSSSLTFNDAVRSICIAPPDFTVDAGTTVIATGWGMLEFDGAYPSRLNQVRIPIISNSDCAAQYPTFTILGSQMCAGDLATGGVDTCLGDSGGPLAILVNENTWYQIGITSFGRNCAEPSNPGIYTRVSSFAIWINENTAVGSSTTAITAAPRSKAAISSMFTRTSSNNALLVKLCLLSAIFFLISIV